MSPQYGGFQLSTGAGRRSGTVLHQTFELAYLTQLICLRAANFRFLRHTLRASTACDTLTPISNVTFT